MTFTPTTKGSFLAGIGLWLMLWLGLFKLDEIVADTHLRRLVSSEGCIQWISKHRSTTLLGTELVQLRHARDHQPRLVWYLPWEAQSSML